MMLRTATTAESGGCHERRNLLEGKFWMNMQQKVDLWNSMELHGADIEKVEPLEVPELAMAAG